MIINHHELHKFVMGEIRVDGWISDWRRDVERRRKEASAKDETITAEQISNRQQKDRP